MYENYAFSYGTVFASRKPKPTFYGNGRTAIVGFGMVHLFENGFTIDPDGYTQEADYVSYFDDFEEAISFAAGYVSQ